MNAQSVIQIMAAAIAAHFLVVMFIFIQRALKQRDFPCHSMIAPDAVIGGYQQRDAKFTANKKLKESKNIENRKIRQQ